MSGYGHANFVLSEMDKAIRAWAAQGHAPRLDKEAVQAHYRKRAVLHTEMVYAMKDAVLLLLEAASCGNGSDGIKELYASKLLLVLDEAVVKLVAENYASSGELEELTRQDWQEQYDFVRKEFTKAAAQNTEVQ